MRSIPRTRECLYSVPRLSGALCSFLCVVLFALSAPALDLGVDPEFTPSLTDGYTRVEAVAVQSDGKILVGGAFPIANGVARPVIARFNADGTLDNTFNPVSTGGIGGVQDIVVMTDGRILIAGLTPGIARLNADGSLDATFNPGTGANAVVNDVLQQSDGKIIISGSFTQYNGTPISRIARLNADGSLDTSFTPPTINSVIYEAAIQSDAKLVIVGGFSSVVGNTRRNLARLNSDGSFDASLDAGTNSFATRPSVAIQPDGKILVGGTYTQKGITRFTSTGAVDGTFASPYDPGSDSTVHSMILLPGGSIIAGGHANLTGGGQQMGVIKLLSNGALDPGFASAPVVDGGLEIFSISLGPDGKIFAGGDLYKLGSMATPSKRMARLNANGSIDASFTGTVEGYGAVRAAKQQGDGKIIAAGSFEAANGTARRNIARFNSDGTLDSSFSSDINGDINAIAIQNDGKIVITGTFSTVAGAERFGIARLDTNGGLDNSFVPGNLSVLGYSCVIQPDGKILVGGFVSLATTLVGITRFNPDGSLDSGFAQPDFSYFVLDIALAPDNKIYIGGSFTNFAGSGRSKLARLNTDGTVDLAFNANTGVTTRKVAVQADGKLMIGGDFTSVNGFPSGRVARLNSDGGYDSAFAVGAGFNSTVFALYQRPDGQGGLKTLAGGSFSSFNGSPKNFLAELNSSAGLTSVEAPTNGSVSVITGQADGKVLVGGQFTSIDGQPRLGIARLQDQEPNAALFDYDGDGKTDFSVFRPSSGAWYLQRSTAGFQGLQFGADGDKLTPADYDGDGKTDIAIYRPSTGIWYILNSSNGTVSYPVFGVAEDLPAPGDYDGDGKADLTVFRPSQGTWYRTNSSNGTTFGMQFGANGDVPTVGDFDGDGKNDLGIFRPSIGDWYNIRSSNGSVFGERFGQTGDRIAPADYDGDGKTDIAIYRPSTGLWVIRNSATATYSYEVFGAPADIPIAGDYDGDGRADIGVWRPSDGTWYIKRSSNSQFIVFPWGQNGDKPTPSAYGN